MIISESDVTADTDDEQIVCWLLATYGYSQNAIYRLTAEQCNSNDRDRIGAVQRSAVATLVEVRHGTGGWFDAIAVTDDDREQRRTTSKAPVALDDDDDFSFQDGTTYVYVYDEPYIATDLDDDEKGGQPDAVLYSSNSEQSHNSVVIIYTTVAALAYVSVLLAL